ncbi:hypothetical protein FNJ87_12345 [Nonlabens mediterrranea]|uniref:DUF1049 domain-containing protein n=1 Tax=Nonlabens mediterrranea TaxID=1419947 RepID=A0ABS0A4A0_9FLAO|nr:hypothetical protein [Nonlabens mediterrranea]MBF4985088.1 hypothetical protein [Nonlabens mediterrranea]
MKKVILLIIILSIALGTLFHFSGISFQLEAFRWKPWAVEVLFMLTVGVLGGYIVYRQNKRWDKSDKK